MRTSVIIAVYQGAATIARAVRSAVEQTLPPHEIIVVDDGSTDDLIGALGPLAADIRLHTQPNAGLSAARNAGVRLATADWCALLDADDWWAPERLERVAAAAIAEPDADLLTTDAFITVEGETVGRFYESRRFIDATDQRVEILRQNFVFGGAIFRKQRLIDVGLFDAASPHQTEYDGWVKLVLSGSRVVLVPEPLAYYSQHASNMSRDVTRTLAGMEHLARELVGGAGPPQLDHDQRAALDEHLRRLRSRSMIYEAMRTMSASDVDARRRSFDAARNAELPMPLRLKFLVAAASPRPVRTRIARRQDPAAGVPESGA